MPLKTSKQNKKYYRNKVREVFKLFGTNCRLCEIKGADDRKGLMDR